MEPAKTSEPRQASFAVGELISPENLEAQFRILSVGRTGMRITRVSTKAIVPREPFLVTFKNVLFKVVGWSGREFTIHTVTRNP